MVNFQFSHRTKLKHIQQYISLLSLLTSDVMIFHSVSPKLFNPVSFVICRFSNILSCARVTIDGVWTGNWIYWIL
jgi:hypothetical protein